MQPQKLTLLRLQKEEASLEREPIPNSLVRRQGQLKFHFCLHGLEGPYEGGYYHGMLELHQNYPFNAPKLFFYTPNGRFDLNMPICTSFTNYHQESWSSAWNVRSLILATISFMYSEQPSYGCRRDSEKKRKDYARNSLTFNLKSDKNFKQFFGDGLRKMGVLDQRFNPCKVVESTESEKKEQSEHASAQINDDSSDYSDYEQEDDIDGEEDDIEIPQEQQQQRRAQNHANNERIQVVRPEGELQEQLLRDQQAQQAHEEQERRRRNRNQLCSVVGKAIIYVAIFGGVCYLAYRLTH